VLQKGVADTKSVIYFTQKPTEGSAVGSGAADCASPAEYSDNGRGCGTVWRFQWLVFTAWDGVAVFLF
jgi:hypothetical protein